MSELHNDILSAYDETYLLFFLFNINMSFPYLLFSLLYILWKLTRHVRPTADLSVNNCIWLHVYPLGFLKILRIKDYGILPITNYTPKFFWRPHIGAIRVRYGTSGRQQFGQRTENIPCRFVVDRQLHSLLHDEEFISFPFPGFLIVAP